MNNPRIRTLLVVTVLLAACALPAAAAPPYAANGLGLMMPADTGPARAMGGAGLAHADGITLLRGNPALFSAVDKYTFLFGASYRRSSTEIASYGTETSAKTDPEALTIALPLWHGLVMGWGLTPYTRTDTNILISHIQDGYRIEDTVNTTGGVNLSSFSLAYSFRDMIRFGYSLNYHFGTIQEEWGRSFPDTDDLIGSVYYLKSKRSGYSHTFGAIAELPGRFSVAASFTTEGALDHTLTAIPNNIISEEIKLGRSDAEVPATYQAGLYARPWDQFEAGLDVRYMMWEDAALTSTEQTMYTDTYQIGGGIRYVPDVRQTASYWRRLPLAAGFRIGTLYYKSYPVVDTIMERAVTAGVEFPLARNIGTLSTSFEVGVRGDKDSNGWSDTFVGFSLALIGKIQ